MDLGILEDVGLTSAEAKVYVALLELGTSTAGPILDKTGLQNSVVHMTLNRLIDRGLISFIKIGKRNEYQAANPKHIIDYLDAKKERLQQILPALLLKQKMAAEKPDITIFRGVKGIREILHELLEAGGLEHHTIGSPYESIMMGDAFWIDYHKRRAKLGITAKLLFNESLRKWKAGKKHPKAEIRYLDQGFEPLMETIIRNDKVAVILWLEKPVGTLIHNPSFADAYEQYFKLMWTKGKK